MAISEHVGKRLAIVLDGTIHSAPVIQEKIAGGTASISGQFTPEEAQDLAISLRSGSLAAPVHVLEQRTVGPALGEASITSGILAALIGTLAVMIIMPLRYGWSGMLANGMLLCTLSLLMGGMAALGATLTLPGIAGVVLTIGMAVDANVLIFERIREELALGLTPPKAIKVRFRACQPFHCGLQPDDDHRRGHPVPVRNLLGARLCRHPDSASSPPCSRRSSCAASLSTRG